MLSSKGRVLALGVAASGFAVVTPAQTQASRPFYLYQGKPVMLERVAEELVVGYVAVVPQWRYAVHRWEVTDTAVYTQTGWWTRERRIAPWSRIQTVDHVEGAVSRRFGLATVTVTTASAAGALEIVGLDRDVARRLVDELTVKADAVEGDAT